MRLTLLELDVKHLPVIITLSTPRFFATNIVRIPTGPTKEEKQIAQ